MLCFFFFPFGPSVNRFDTFPPRLMIAHSPLRLLPCQIGPWLRRLLGNTMRAHTQPLARAFPATFSLSLRDAFFFFNWFHQTAHLGVVPLMLISFGVLRLTFSGRLSPHPPGFDRAVMDTRTHTSHTFLQRTSCRNILLNILNGKYNFNRQKNGFDRCN